MIEFGLDLPLNLTLKPVFELSSDKKIKKSNNNTDWKTKRDPLRVNEKCRLDSRLKSLFGDSRKREGKPDEVGRVM